MSQQSNKHMYFVYDGVEVIKTGRIASRNQQVRGYNGTRVVTENVVEIAPMVRAGEIAWKKWVREDELFVINDVAADAQLPVDDGIVPISTDPLYIDPVDDILNTLRGKKKDGLS